MLLALSVISHQSRRLGASSFRVFDEHGGSIGRGKNNDWILDDPDALLSSRHAIFRSVDGQFLIEDASTNGTGLNRRDALVPRGQSVPLSDGDRLFLGSFEILVQFIEPLDRGAPPAPPEQPQRQAPQESAPATQESLTGAEMGSILRIVTQGLIEVLGDRAAIKRMFRLRFTALRTLERNPLNSAESAQEALNALFVHRAPAAMQPLDAFRRAFDDMVHHQLAMLAGIEAAYAETFGHFDPRRIETECDAAQKRGVFGRLLRNDYWEYYRQLFARTFGESGTAYQQIFGESFARAYEREIERLEKALVDRLQ